MLFLVVSAFQQQQESQTAMFPSASTERKYKYQMTFVVAFNVSDGADISKNCGEHFAATFLGNLLHYELVLQCKDKTTEVRIGTKASVKLPGRQVRRDDGLEWREMRREDRLERVWGERERGEK